MTDQRTKWLRSMMFKYNTDEDGVRQIMRERQQKSMLNPNRQKGVHKGGFAKPGAASAAANKRWSNQ